MSVYSLRSLAAVTLKPEKQGFGPIKRLLSSNDGSVFKIHLFGQDNLTHQIKFILWKDHPDSISVVCNILPHQIQTKSGDYSYCFETDEYTALLNISDVCVSCRLFRRYKHIDVINAFNACVYL